MDEHGFSSYSHFVMKILRIREVKYLTRVTQLVMIEPELESSKSNPTGLILNTRHVASAMQGCDPAMCVIFSVSILFNSFS